MNIAAEALKPYLLEDDHDRWCDTSSAHMPPYYVLGEATTLCRDCLNDVLDDARSILAASYTEKGKSSGL